MKVDVRSRLCVGMMPGVLGLGFRVPDQQLIHMLIPITLPEGLDTGSPKPFSPKPLNPKPLNP